MAHRPLEYPRIGGRHPVGSEALYRGSTCRHGHAGEQPTVAVEPANKAGGCLDIADREQKPRPWFNDEVCNIANMRGDGNTSAGESLDKCNRLTFEAGWQQKYVMLSHDACDSGRRNDSEETYPVHLAGEKTAQLRIIRAVTRNCKG